MVGEECNLGDHKLREVWEETKRRKGVSVGEGMGIETHSSTNRRMLSFAKKECAEIFLKENYESLPLSPQFPTQAHKYNYKVKKGPSRQEAQRNEAKKRSNNQFQALDSQSSSSDEEEDEN